MKKSFLSLFVSSLFASVPPALAEEITYEGDGAALKPPPSWISNTPSDDLYLYPGTEENPGASGNTVTINYDPKDGAPDNPAGVSGGFSRSDASGNTVNLISGKIENTSGNANLYGGYAIAETGSTAAATASRNTVTIDDGEFNVTAAQADNRIFGGHAQSSGTATATSSDNNVTINNGIFSADGTGNSGNTIHGGNAYGPSGMAVTSGNTLTINGGEFTANGTNYIHGGKAQSPNLTISSNNTLIITGGNFSAGSDAYNEIYGGYAYTTSVGAATASYNTVIITGGNFSSGERNSIIGGYAYSVSGTETATHNTVIIGSEADLGENAIIWGGTGYGGSSDLFTGNRLFIAGQRTVESIGNFEYLNFTLPAEMTNGDTLITATDSVNLNLSAPDSGNAAITVESISVESGSSLSAGDTVTLIQAEGNMEGTLANTSVTAASDSFASATEWDLAMTTGEGGSLTATLAGYGLNPQTHAFLSGRAAQTSLLGQGADLITGQGLSSLHESIRTGNQAFFAMQGGSNRYKTGSGINMDSFSLMAGAAWGTKINPDTEAAIGAFVEAGTGSYNSSNSFTGMSSVRGSGNTDFLGVGLLGYVEWANGLYADASVRAGRVESDLSTNAVHGGSTGGYDDVSSLYVGAHAGIGYRLALAKASTLDMYTRYLYTHMEGNSVTILGDKYRFDSSDSHRWRTGLRYGYRTNSIMPYAGVAYEYEFDGKAGGSVAGYRLEETDMGGATVIGEIGLAWMPNENARLNVALEGFAGQRDGVMGNLRFNYRF